MTVSVAGSYFAGTPFDRAISIAEPPMTTAASNVDETRLRIMVARLA